MSNNLDVLWSDSTLQQVCLAYDDVRIEIRESTGRRVVVIGHGQIGLEVVGFWDETVIDDAAIVAAHPFAERCLRDIEDRLGAARSKTGSPARDSGDFTTLVVSLTDGVQVRCAASTFTSEVESRDSP